MKAMRIPNRAQALLNGNQTHHIRHFHELSHTDTSILFEVIYSRKCGTINMRSLIINGHDLNTSTLTVINRSLANGSLGKYF